MNKLFNIRINKKAINKMSKIIIYKFRINNNKFRS